MDRARAELLKDRVNLLIQCAKDSDGEDFGAVNWCGLKVTDVCSEISHLHGEEEHFILVEEASANSKLGPWLTKALNEPGIFVKTEW